MFCYHIDIDECLTGKSGCQHDCVNLNGSYYCLCRSGYRLRQDNITCDGKLILWFSYNLILGYV